MNEQRAPQPAWDDYDAYLFDIDGTLLSCSDAVHYFAFCDALSQIAGRPLNLDGVVAHGNTDIGILRDAFSIAGVTEESWRPVLSEIRAKMCAFFGARTSDLCITVLPSVTDVLDHLKARGALLGVATGNLEQIGRLKLSNCGLLDQFDFGAFSDMCEYRYDVFKAALTKVYALRGGGARVCVVGDTPEDVRAARANRLDVIAVATGTYSYEQLRSENPDRCLHTLQELLVQKS